MTAKDCTWQVDQRKLLDISKTALVRKVSHVMIDLETWSLRPDASIAEFAIVCLDSKFKVLHTFDCLIEGSSFNFGHYDQDTAEWHRANTTLHQRIKAGEYSWNIVRLLQTLNELLSVLPSATLIWCNGTDFDIPILRNMAIAYDTTLKFPSYRNVRDLRTFIAIATSLGWTMDAELEVVTHQALDDCLRQSAILLSVMNYLSYLAGGKHDASITPKPPIHS